MICPLHAPLGSWASLHGESTDMQTVFDPEMLLICHFLSVTGLSAPVPRGRKGKKTKNQMLLPEIKNADWITTCNPEIVLQDDSYKKHLKQHCNKWVNRFWPGAPECISLSYELEHIYHINASKSHFPGGKCPPGFISLKLWARCSLHVSALVQSFRLMKGDWGES